jgi:hypothetical protein
MTFLTRREKRFLDLLYPDGSVSVDLTVGALLHQKGYVQVNKQGRYELTRKGMMAVISARRAYSDDTKS